MRERVRVGHAFGRWVIVLSSVVSSSLAGCTAWGTDVDLGGGADGGARGADSGACAAPDVSAPCVACKPSDKTCQPNGCFGGYLCDVKEKDCKDPSMGCPSE